MLAVDTTALAVAVGVSYVVTRFATTLESLWVYYTITDKSAVAFTREYSKVSISSGNEKCKEPELIRPGGMVTKDRMARVNFG
jgi:hypothetical protein